MTDQPVVILKGAKSIAKAIGKRADDIGALKRDEHLPVYKENPAGPWCACIAELHEWAIQRARRIRENSVNPPKCT